MRDVVDDLAYKAGFKVGSLWIRASSSKTGWRVRRYLRWWLGEFKRGMDA